MCVARLITTLPLPFALLPPPLPGPALRPGFESFCGLHDLAVRHGMTVGELARLFRAERRLDLELDVVGCEGWRRGMGFRETGLPWVFPSPNMPTPETALVYPGMCLLEGTNLSEGRGTTRPFHTISFLDDLTGWQATLYMFGSTRDGGTTWADVPLPQGLDDIVSIDLIAPGTGFLLDFSGTLYFTRDNGIHWSVRSRLDLGGLVIPRAAYQMAAMRFTDESHGMIVVSEEYQAGKVKAFHTSDGGASWTLRGTRTASAVSRSWRPTGPVGSPTS